MVLCHSMNNTLPDSTIKRRALIIASHMYVISYNKVYCTSIDTNTNKHTLSRRRSNILGNDASYRWLHYTMYVISIRKQIKDIYTLILEVYTKNLSLMYRWDHAEILVPHLYTVIKRTFLNAQNHEYWRVFVSPNNIKFVYVLIKSN